MELRVLKYFLVAAREENITKAAALLHVTQPTLSRQIKELEEGVESSASRVMALENENVHLKARLYDILMK